MSDVTIPGDLAASLLAELTRRRAVATRDAVFHAELNACQGCGANARAYAGQAWRQQEPLLFALREVLLVALVPASPLPGGEESRG